MNCGGNLIVLNRDISETYNTWFLKKWYIMLCNPMTIEDYYQAECFANIYINEMSMGMKYILPNKTNLLEHIETHLV